MVALLDPREIGYVLARCKFKIRRGLFAREESPLCHLWAEV